MRARMKERITLLVMIGFAVFVIGAIHVPDMNSAIYARPQGASVSAYTPHDAIHIDGNADFISQATAELWPGNGTAEAPYLITGYYFYDVTHSVEVWNVDLHWAFVNNEVDGPYDGTVWCSIELDNCTNAEVSGNLFHHRFRGIWFVDITNVIISNNTIVDNLSQGIEVVGSANNVVIANNYINNCDGAGIRVQGGANCEIYDNRIENVGLTGIQLLTSAADVVVRNNQISNLGSMGIVSGPATSVSIMHNQITNLTSDGMYIQSDLDCDIYNNSISEGSGDGITLKDTNSSVFRNNSISTVDGIGIFVEEGNNSLFRYNHIESCTGYAFETDSAAGNMTITQNIFISNGVLSSQIKDEGGDNTFVYNYYSEWTSPDADSDLIVDNPYSLDGIAGNQDPFPLANPNAIPPTSETTTTTTTQQTAPLPLEMLMLAGGIAVVVCIGAFFIRRK